MIKEKDPEFLIKTEDVDKVTTLMSKMLVGEPVMLDKIVKRTLFTVQSGPDKKEEKAHWIRIMDGDVEEGCTITYKNKMMNMRDEEKAVLKVDNYDDAIHLFDLIDCYDRVSYQENLRSQFVCTFDQDKYIVRFDIWPKIEDVIFVTVTARSFANPHGLKDFTEALGLNKLNICPQPRVDVDKIYEERFNCPAISIPEVTFEYDLQFPECNIRNDDYTAKETENSRNGYSKKNVVSSMGEISLDIRRDRKGYLELKIVKKNQTDISNIEDQVLSMYAKGMSARDISTHLYSVYGVEASAEMISKMTERILSLAKEWQNRPLDRKYAVVFMDAIHFYVRQDNATVEKAVYIAIGIRLNGLKEVLGMWVRGNESAKYWLGVLTEIKNRGVEDILIVPVDGLTRFGDAIHVVYPQTEVQRCIIHQIRYSTKFISHKDIIPFMADLKEVYQASTEEIALQKLDGLEEKWEDKYPSSIASWRNNWLQISTHFKYPPEIRRIIYTTDSIDNFIRQLRKVTKSKTIFPTDDALFKQLYLAMLDITKKWEGKPWNWGQILEQLCIYFEERITTQDLD